MRRCKKIVIITSSFLFMCTILIIYLAYFYKPKGYNDFQSIYLKEVNSQYVDLPNYNAHFVKQGKGEPLILIHGGGTWLYSYRNNIAELAKHFEVYAVDMPGHGYTTAITEPKYDLDTYADFLNEFMDSQHIKKAHVVGNSWGGGWALYFTQKYPDSVNQLVLIDSSGVDAPDKSEWKYFGYPIVGELATKFISLNNVKKSLENMVYNKKIITDLDAKEIYKPLSEINNRRAQYLAQRNIDWKITDSGMRNLSQEILIIFGDSDCYFDEKYAERMKNQLKNVKYIRLENSGHLPHEEKPEIINQIIIDRLLD